MKCRMLVMALFAVVASPADVNGTWKGTADTPNGTTERTFVFKAQGDQLTGETSSEMMGKSEIRDGKIQENDLSFNIMVDFQGTQMKLNYTGKIEGDEIKFHVEAEGGIAVDYIAKRVS